jgi:hypothetical protein
MKRLGQEARERNTGLKLEREINSIHIITAPISSGALPPIVTQSEKKQIMALETSGTYQLCDSIITPAGLDKVILCI